MKVTNNTNASQELSLTTELASKPMSRRQFMERAAVLGMSMSVASSIWSQKVIASTPRRGGSLRMGLDGGSTTDTFDPKQSIGTPHITQAILCCVDTLVELDANANPVPGLSEGWEPSSDGLTWTIKLRKGVEFHDGRPVSADDVIWSLSLQQQEDNKFADGATIMGAVESMKADNAETVVIKLKEVNYDFPQHLSSYGLGIHPQGTTDWNKGIGTGPYMLEEFEPGVRAVVKRAPNFYRDDQGFFDEIEMLNIADAVARSSAAQTGAVDVVFRPDAKTATKLGEVSGLTLVVTESNVHMTTDMRTDTDPFTDNNIRMAVKYAIKRQEFVDKVLGGFGYPGNDHPIGRKMRYFNSDLPQREYDPDQAKHYLQQAGLTSIDLELYTSDGAFSGAVDSAVLIQESARAAGININVKKVAGDGYWSDTWSKVPWSYCYWNGRATVDWQFSLGYISTAAWNATYFKNERFDQLLVDARKSADESLRREIYFELQKMLHDEGGTVVLGFGSHILAATDKLGHGEVRGNQPADDHRLGRYWWFNA